MLKKPPFYSLPYYKPNQTIPDFAMKTFRFYYRGHRIPLFFRQRVLIECKFLDIWMSDPRLQTRWINNSNFSIILLDSFFTSSIKNQVKKKPKPNVPSKKEPLDRKKLLKNLTRFIPRGLQKNFFTPEIATTCVKKY